MTQKLNNLSELEANTRAGPDDTYTLTAGTDYNLINGVFVLQQDIDTLGASIRTGGSGIYTNGFKILTQGGNIDTGGGDINVSGPEVYAGIKARNIDKYCGKIIANSISRIDIVEGFIS